MIRPFLKDEALLADIAAAREDPGRPHLWWLGQSGFLVQWAGRHLLLDPYLSDSLTRKYAATDKPHVRMTERVIDPARLGFVDVVTSSHNHTDHLDAETLRPLAAANPSLRMVFPEANRAVVAQRCGLPPERLMGMDATVPGRPMAPGAPSRIEAAGFGLEAVPAAHEELDRDKEGRLIYLGFVVKAGPWTLYHSGDTVPYPGMAALLRPHRVDIALLPINGRAPERRVSGNMSGSEAAGLARGIGAGIAVPCHYDMFEFNTATTEEFVMHCQRRGQGYAVLRGGERLSPAPR